MLYFLEGLETKERLTYGLRLSLNRFFNDGFALPPASLLEPLLFALFELFVVIVGNT